MKVEYTLTPEDTLAYFRYHAKQAPARRRRRGPPGWLWLILLLLLTVLLVLTKLARPEPFSLSILDWALAAAFLLWLVLYFFGHRMAVNLAMRRARGNPRLFQRRTLEITEDALQLSDQSGANSTRWHAIPWIIENGEYAYFYLTDQLAIILPKRAFADTRQFEEFVDTARRYQEEARRFVREESVG